MAQVLAPLGEAVLVVHKCRAESLFVRQCVSAGGKKKKEVREGADLRVRVEVKPGLG